VAQKWWKYSPEFRARALEMFRDCRNVSALARELGVRRKFLYQWRDQAAVGEEAGRAARVQPAEVARDAERERLRRKVTELEQLAGRQAAELDFFKGALRRVEERRQGKGASGGAASTSKSK
jgi:transposase